MIGADAPAFVQQKHPVPSKTKIDKYSITFIGRFVQTGGAKKEHNIKVETADKTRHARGVATNLSADFEKRRKTEKNGDFDQKSDNKAKFKI